jgi:GH25 family lysozyme M1 (1,4-beta-N-acetylmuramidase)
MSIPIEGIDVSKHQGLVNWPRVKAAGKDFVFIRLGWCGYDGAIQANNGLDSCFFENMKGALAAGLSVGVYVYSYAKTEAAAEIAAKETLQLVEPYAIAYPIAFDIEDTQYATMSKSLNTAIAAAFLSVVEQARYYALLYTYKSFAENYLDMGALSAYDVWIAQYASKNTYAGKYGIWQYAGDGGKCDGVDTSCDLNVAYKDYAAIIAAAGLNKPHTTPPTDQPTDQPDTTLEEALALLEDIEKAVAGLKALINQKLLR